MKQDIRNEIDQQQCREFLNAAMEITDEIRAVINAKIESGFDIQTKADNSVVTDVDKEAEQLFRRRIGQRYPDHSIIGEEFPADDLHSEFQWFIDPIDGTEEFVRQIPTYGTIIGLHYNGKPLIGIMDHPALDARIYGAFRLGTFYNGMRIRMSDPGRIAPVRGNERIFMTPYSSFTKWTDETHLFNRIVTTFPNIRIFHACYAYTLAITGGADAMVEYNVRLWDLAACQILIEEAGGAYHCIQHQQRANGEVTCGAIFGHPDIVRKLYELIKS